MERKNYLPVLTALEQFVSYAMKFRLKRETPSGETRVHRISGIRLVYLGGESCRQTFSEGEDFGSKRICDVPELLVTLFYDRSFVERGRKKCKKASRSVATNSVNLSTPQGLSRELKKMLPSLVNGLFDEFYASKLEDSKEAEEMNSEVIALEDDSFFLDCIGKAPQSFSKKV